MNWINKTVAKHWVDKVGLSGVVSQDPVVNHEFPTSNGHQFL